MGERISIPVGLWSLLFISVTRLSFNEKSCLEFESVVMFRLRLNAHVRNLISLTSS